MSDRKPVGIVLHEKADRMYVICDDGTAYSAKVGQPGIVMGWHEIEPIPGTAAEREHAEELDWELTEEPTEALTEAPPDPASLTE